MFVAVQYLRICLSGADIMLTVQRGVLIQNVPAGDLIQFIS